VGLDLPIAIGDAFGGKDDAGRFAHPANILSVLDNPTPSGCHNQTDPLPPLPLPDKGLANRQIRFTMSAGVETQTSAARVHHL
jgi:hypothetical protein